MKVLQTTAIAFLWLTGLMGSSCAQAQEKPPPAPAFGEDAPPAPPPPPERPFGQEPPDAPPPPRPPRDQEEHREKVMRLEAEIKDLERAVHQDDLPDERRAALKERLGERKKLLKELLAKGAGGPDDRRKAHHDKLRGIEAEIEKLEVALENKDAKPEERKHLMARLNDLRAARHEMLGQMKNSDARGQDMAQQERMAARLRAIHDMLAKGVDPGTEKELRAESAKLQDELARRNPRQHGAPGVPPDPESQKMHMMAQELERASMDLSHKLRLVPKDNKDDRADVMAKLKDTVTQLFDLREKLRAREVDMIKKRLDELNQLLEKRKANRDAIIEKRLKQLSGESDDLDW